MGAIMAEAAVAAGLAAAGSNISRPGGASSRARVDAVRPSAPVGTSRQGFTKIFTADTAGDTGGRQPVAEPGNGMLSNGVQLVLAETRTLEAAAAQSDRSSVDRALSSYVASQASVRETIGLSQFQASGRTAQPPALAPKDTAA